MKKKIVIVLVVLIIILIVVGIVIKNIKEKEKLEVIQLMRETAKCTIFIENSEDNNLNKIEEQLRNIENVESVQFFSKEENLQKMKGKFFENPQILDGYNGSNNIFPNSFIITIKIENTNNFNKDYFQNIDNDINKIEGIRKITNEYETYIKVYEEQGMKGIKEYKELKEYNEK